MYTCTAHTVWIYELPQSHYALMVISKDIIDYRFTLNLIDVKFMTLSTELLYPSEVLSFKYNTSQIIIQLNMNPQNHEFLLFSH